MENYLEVWVVEIVSFTRSDNLFESFRYLLIPIRDYRNKLLKQSERVEEDV